MCAELLASIEENENYLCMYLSELQQDSDEEHEKKKLLQDSGDPQDASDTEASKPHGAAARRKKQQATSLTGALEIRAPHASSKVRYFFLSLYVQSLCLWFRCIPCQSHTDT